MSTCTEISWPLDFQWSQLAARLLRCLHTSLFRLGWASYSLTPDIWSQWRSQRPDQKRIGSDSWSTFEYEGIETGKQMILLMIIVIILIIRRRPRAPAAGSQQRTNGINTNGVTAKVLFVDRKCIWVLFQKYMFSTFSNPSKIVLLQWPHECWPH